MSCNLSFRNSSFIKNSHQVTWQTWWLFCMELKSHSKLEFLHWFNQVELSFGWGDLPLNSSSLSFGGELSTTITSIRLVVDPLGSSQLGQVDQVGRVLGQPRSKVVVYIFRMYLNVVFVWFQRVPCDGYIQKWKFYVMIENFIKTKNLMIE